MDFAADDPFAKVPSKLREHYGFEIGESTIQRIALGHSQAIFESDRNSDLDFPKEPGLYEQIVAETDGGMIPVMEPDAEQEDKRKGNTVVAGGQESAVDATLGAPPRRRRRI